MDDQQFGLTSQAPAVDCAVLVLDETGQVVSSNPMAQHLLRCSAEELAGRNCALLANRDPLVDGPGGGASCDPNEPLTSLVLESHTGERVTIRGTRVTLDASVLGRPVTLVLLNHQCAPPPMAQLSTAVLDDISHALRTPLCSVVGYLDLLAEQYQQFRRAELGKMLKVLRRNAHWAEHLVDNLLSELRLCTGHFQIEPRSTYLGALLEEAAVVVEMLTAGAQRTLTLVLPDSRTTIWADRDRLLQILVNVLTNAVKRIPEDGHITVTATEGDGCSHISVSDDTPGMAWWERGYAPVDVTEPQKLANYPAYTGLGLTLAKSVIELHGGSITLSCGAGQGSTMKFTLPSSPPEILAGPISATVLTSDPTADDRIERSGSIVLDVAAVPAPVRVAAMDAQPATAEGVSMAGDIGTEAMH